MINHYYLLCHKLKWFGIDKHFLEWLYSYLTNQTQAVKFHFIHLTILQSIFSKFVLGSEKKCLSLYIDKCQVIYFTCKKPIKFHINTFLLSKVNSIKNLVIYFENDLSFKNNHKIIVTKSYRMLGFINRSTKDFINPLCLKTLNSSLVRSNIEFGTFIWSCNFSMYSYNNELNMFKISF